MRLSFGGLTALGLLMTSVATAQNTAAPPAAEVGRVVEGRLDQAEIRHPLQLRAGQTVRVAARSRSFDPQLKIYGPTGGEPLAQDDDSGGGTTAELTFTATTAGTYRLGVSVSGDSEEARPRGAYDLTVVAATTPVQAPPRALTPNGPSITVDITNCGAGCRFTFNARAGDRLIAETSDASSDADPVLELYRGSEKLGEDDDGGDGSNARLVRALDRAGSYTLLVRSYEGHDGPVGLTVKLSAHQSRPPGTLAVGAPAGGTITPDAELSAQGKYYDAYRLHGRAGQQVAIDMASTDFDAVVELWGDSAIGPTMLASNDDADGGPGRRATTTNAHLVVTFVRDGDVEVRAASLDKPGRYTLRVSEPAR